MSHTLRFNAFSMIHKALRGMLYDAATCLQHADFTNTEDARAVFQKIDIILELFDDHADHEDALILPMVNDHDKALVTSFEEEHVKDRNLCVDLRSGMAAYHDASTPAERVMAGNKVFFAFNEFIAFNLQHTNREETVLNEVLWENYTDQDIMAVNQKIAANIPPEKAIINVTWMMRSCNNMELAGFMKMIRATAPPERVALLMGLAQKELAPARWELIQEMIGQAIPA